MWPWPVARSARVPPAGEPCDILPEELARALASPEPPLVLDVRTAGEYAEGHIPGARWLPLPELGQRAGELPRDRVIVCVCRSGGRSLVATKELLARGYSARNLAGGMLRWPGAVVRGHAPGREAPGRGRFGRS